MRDETSFALHLGVYASERRLGRPSRSIIGPPLVNGPKSPCAAIRLYCSRRSGDVSAAVDAAALARSVSDNYVVVRANTELLNALNRGAAGDEARAPVKTGLSR